MPKTFAFVPTSEGPVSDQIVKNLIDGKPPERTYYLPEMAYRQPILGRIVFVMEDHDRNLTLDGLNQFDQKELGFTKPICSLLTENPYRLLCESKVFVDTPQLPPGSEHLNGYVITTPLNLTSDVKVKSFPKPFRLKFENIVTIIAIE